MIECLPGQQEYTRITIKNGTASIWTSDPFMAAALDRLNDAQPDTVAIKEEHKRIDARSSGKTDWKEYTLPSGMIRIVEETI